MPATGPRLSDAGQAAAVVFNSRASSQQRSLLTPKISIHNGADARAAGPGSGGRLAAGCPRRWRPLLGAGPSAHRARTGEKRSGAVTRPSFRRAQIARLVP